MKLGLITKPRPIYCALAWLLSPIGIFAVENISFKGHVKDQTGFPIIGANILHQATNNGVVTDIDGNFEFLVPDTATLVVSYIGYLNQNVKASKKPTTIVLKENTIALDEALVIGYGSVKKSDATGSVVAIKPDEMNRGLTTNAQDMMAGKIAGVSVVSDGGTPGGGATIRIRGGSSLSASNDPLIVIDGLAMDNDGIKGVSNPLSTINPNDIESFTVLKDASATAIYGSRASNGVIIITTKKGSKGAKPTISYSGNVSISTKKGEVEVLDGDQFRSFVKELYKDRPEVIEKLGQANTNWQDEIFQTAVGTDHNLTVSGGLKNMPYRVSVGYTNQDGILKTSEFERYTASMNLSPSFFNDHLRVNINAKGMIANNRFANTGAIGSAISFDPTQSVYDNREQFNNYGGYFQWLDNSNIYNNLSPQNPVGMLNLKNERANAKSFLGNAQFDYKFHFLPELRANLNMAMDYSTGKQTLYVDPTAAECEGYGREGYEDRVKTNKSLDFYLQYAKEFGVHGLDVMAGYAWQHFYNKGNYEYYGITDPTRLPSIGQYKSESFLVSFFGRVNYNLLDRYLLTVTMRRDGTSRFPVDNRWSMFPSVALGWKINEESFMQQFHNLSDLKLRVGYGITGQQNLNQGDYPYIPIYSDNQDGAFYPFDGIYFPTSRPEAYNLGLKWEETTTYNAGFDFGFLGNRINGSVDAYYRRTDDLLNVVDIAAGTNFTNRLISNVGSLENKGIEFAINAKPIVTKNFTWDIGYNITYNENKITDLIGGTSEGYLIETGGISSGTGNNIQAHTVGLPASSFYVYEQVYDNNGNPIDGLFVDRNGDGVINDQDRYFYKKPAADVLMGLNSKMIYKNWDFGFSLRASLGNYVYNDVASGRANVGESGVYSSSGFLTNRPTSAFETNFGGASNSYMSDYYVQNASFLRVDNITLGYSFSNLFKKGINGRIYGSVSNPFVFTKYKGLDPEVNGGIDNNLYPRPMVSLIGVSITL